jgi:hypothetical protein
MGRDSTLTMAAAHLATTRGGAGSPRREAARASWPSPPPARFSSVTPPLPSLLSLAPRVRVPAGFDLGSCLRLQSTPARLRALGVVGTSNTFY